MLLWLYANQSKSKLKKIISVKRSLSGLALWMKKDLKRSKRKLETQLAIQQSIELENLKKQMKTEEVLNIDNVNFYYDELYSDEMLMEKKTDEDFMADSNKR